MSIMFCTYNPETSKYIAFVQGTLDTCQADSGDTPAADIKNVYILKIIVAISFRVSE